MSPASPSATPALLRWDIFCSIVDNYGDIGVCWRLARQLAQEHGLQDHGLKVRLWLDKPEVARQLIPALDLALPSQTPASQTPASQTIDQVEICHWHAQHPWLSDVADVVIEAFACELPSAYLQQMQIRRPLWINLEYLSAESWVEGFHGGHSVHPATGLNKHFFFPGFSASTGGLLREARLMEERTAFQQDQSQQTDFWQQIGVTVQPSPALKISLFCYPHAPLHSLLETLAQSDTAVQLLVPSGQIASQTQAWLAQYAGNRRQPGQLSVSIIPFLTQPMYDRLLWACDLNLVRGEDSWIRALWAGRPLIWQPYFQQEDSHLEKLQAFLARYTDQTFPESCSDSGTESCTKLNAAIMDAHQAWNADGFPLQHWQALQAMLPQWQTHALAYANRQAEQEDLAAKLVIYCKNLF